MLDFIENIMLYRVVSIIATIDFAIHIIIFAFRGIRMIKERKNEILMSIALYLASYMYTDEPIKIKYENIAIYKFI